MIPGYTKEAFIKSAAPNTTNPDGGKKNTLGPYYTPFTSKAMQPADDLIKGAYGDLYRNITERYGNAEFGEYKKGQNFINQRAGDPKYIQGQHKLVMDYVNNPANGWNKQTDGTYVNTRTGQVYDPTLGGKFKYDKVGYDLSPDSQGRSWGGYMMLPSKTRDSYQDLSSETDPYQQNVLKHKDMTVAIHPDTSSYLAPAYASMGADDINKYVPVLTAGHEFNHGFTMDLINKGLIKPYINTPEFKRPEGKRVGFEPVGFERLEFKRPEFKSYAVNPVELGNAASLFQQQHYRNTGSRIVDKTKFWEDFNNAKKNIQDYDPESRRFMQSIDILQNEASNDPEAAYMLDQIIEAMPLITNNSKHTIPGYTYNPTVVG